VVDITCPACDITYHADENHLGRGFRCKVCGKILRVERPELASIPLQEVMQATTSKEQSRSRDRWIGIGVLAGGAIFFTLLFWRRNLRPDNPPVSTTTNQGQSIPAPVPAPGPELSHLKPVTTSHIKIPHPLKPLDPPKLTPLVPIPFEPVPVYREGQAPVTSSATIPPTSKPVVIVPKCAEGRKPERPSTGERIEPDQETSGESTLEITNGPISDAAIRLVDGSTNLTVRFIYVRARDMYTIQGIEPGTYSLRYASGLDWFPTCGEFTRNGSLVSDT
jgi:hypothetical protein